MYTRLSHIECPVCRNKVEYRFFSPLNRQRLDLINTEIQCPVCESELIMNENSRKKLKWMFIISLSSLPVFVVMLADRLNWIDIFPNLHDTIGIGLVLVMLVYLVYTVFTIKYAPEKESKSEKQG